MNKKQKLFVRVASLAISLPLIVLLPDIKTSIAVIVGITLAKIENDLQIRWEYVFQSIIFFIRVRVFRKRCFVVVDRFNEGINSNVYYVKKTGGITEMPYLAATWETFSAADDYACDWNTLHKKVDSDDNCIAIDLSQIYTQINYRSFPGRS